MGVVQSRPTWLTAAAAAALRKAKGVGWGWRVVGSVPVNFFWQGGHVNF